MDELDRRILEQLQVYPRRSNTLLARSLGVGQATIRRRIDELVSSGAIIFTVLPNLKLLGYPTRAYFGLQVEPARLARVSEQLCLIPELRFVGACMGNPDLIARGDFKSMESLADFVTVLLGNIKGISHIDTTVELKTVKMEYNRPGMPDLARSGTYRSKRASDNDGSQAIDENDRRLITALQKDGRAPLKRLAAEVGFSETKVHGRIRELIASGYIELTAMPHPGFVDYPQHCAVGIETDPSKARQVVATLARLPRVYHISIVSGPVNILAVVYASSYDNLSEIVAKDLKTIDGVIRIGSVVFSKTLKQNFTWL